MIRLSINQILMLHADIVKASGGDSGLRELGLLQSAANSPFQTFDGVSLYPTIQEKAARLGFGLIMNHTFLDGNKRIGAHAMLVLLRLNGIMLTYTNQELSDIILSVAAGAKGYNDLLDWILTHSK